jgi:hypothetical protein
LGYEAGIIMDEKLKEDIVDVTRLRDQIIALEFIAKQDILMLLVLTHLT